MRYYSRLPHLLTILPAKTESERMITISKEKKNTLHIASCSFGKDSLATILLALEHGEPLDEAVYCGDVR